MYNRDCSSIKKIDKQLTCIYASVLVQKSAQRHIFLRMSLGLKLVDGLYAHGPPFAKPNFLIIRIIFLVVDVTKK